MYELSFISTPSLSSTLYLKNPVGHRYSSLSTPPPLSSHPSHHTFPSVLKSIHSTACVRSTLWKMCHFGGPASFFSQPVGPYLLLSLSFSVSSSISLSLSLNHENMLHGLENGDKVLPADAVPKGSGLKRDFFSGASSYSHISRPCLFNGCL